MPCPMSLPPSTRAQTVDQGSELAPDALAAVDGVPAPGAAHGIDEMQTTPARVEQTGRFRRTQLGTAVGDLDADPLRVRPHVQRDRVSTVSDRVGDKLADRQGEVLAPACVQVSATDLDRVPPRSSDDIRVSRKSNHDQLPCCR